MAASRPRATPVPDTDAQFLDSWRRSFALGWEPGRLAEWGGRLPADRLLRRAVLFELVRIDLSQQWRHGRQAPLEEYLKAYPELGGAESVPVDLLRAEVEARQRAGVPVRWKDLLLRFPRQAAELKEQIKLSRGGDSAVARQTIPPNPTTRPGGPSLAGPVSLPEQFGRYRILKPLGQGGMGTVYLAHDTHLERPVALKVPHFSPQDGAEVLERFYREARAAAALRHPNICPVYDVGELNGVRYLTMAYVDGATLSSLLRDGPPLPRAAAAIVRQLALALEVAHSNGVIHRDLKPSNVMLTPDGEPVIMDFGLARRIDADDARLTKTGALIGTVAYMAPEQARGLADDQGPSCDIYSLGVILYELLSGRLPFEGPPLAILAQILVQDASPPAVHRPGLDPKLEAICLKAMAKQAGDRFASMAEFAAALTPAADPAPVPTPPPVALPPVSRFQVWRALAASGLVVLLLVVALAGWLRPGPSAPPVAPGEPIVSALPAVPDVKVVAPAPVDPPRLPPASLRLTSPAALVVKAGGRQKIAVQVDRSGCQGAIALRIEGLPPGVSAHPAEIPPDQGRTWLELSAAPEAAAADQTARVVATLDNLAASEALRVSVVESPSLAVAPIAAVSVRTGERQQVEVRVLRRGCQGPVTVELEGLPEGVTAVPRTLRVSDERLLIDLQASSEVADASSMVRVVARLDDLRAEGSFQLTVTRIVTLRLVPIVVLTLKPGEKLTWPVRVARRGCRGPVSLELRGLPSKVTHRLPAIPADGDSAPLQLEAAADAGELEKIVRVVATLGDLRDEHEFRLCVMKPAAAGPAPKKNPKLTVKEKLALPAGLAGGFPRNTTLQEAIDVIGARHDLSIVIEARGGKDISRRPVSLQGAVAGVTVRAVLDHLAKQVQATYEVRPDCIVVRPK